MNSNRPPPRLPPLTIPTRRLSSIASLPPIDNLVSKPELPPLRPRTSVSSTGSNEPPPISLHRPGIAHALIDGCPLKPYHLDGYTYIMKTPESGNETLSVFSRRTVTNKLLTYQLKVIQQPVRARACGAGSKFDPPPVVELRIFEGENMNKDITMVYDASFVLFASLDSARPIAQGKIHSAPMPPALTGVPCAGPNYLDRPSQAGYFIFSDLSVRHEGWYRLTFSLFEAIKDPQDASPNEPFMTSADASKASQAGHVQPCEGMSHRMDVISEVFQVWSAKKFPGLKESTELSKVVAEQGCRVRIRREVRMRKRGAAKDDRGDRGEDNMRSYRATPESNSQPPTPVDRTHSVSRSSLDGSQYGADHYRRISTELPQQTPTAYALPGVPLGPLGHRNVIETSAPYPQVPTTAQPGYQHQYSNPQALPAPPSPAFTKPSPRNSIDSQPHISALFHPVEYRPTNVTNPDGRALPRVITPEPPKMGPEITGSATNKLAPLRYDGHRTQYDLPPCGPAPKRSYSPHSSGQSGALKSGMRPDMPSSLPSYSGPGAILAASAGIDSDDDSDDSFTYGPMLYKRADGSHGGKWLNTPSHSRRYDGKSTW